MQPFEYLSVLISIVLGLALTQLLTGVGRLIQARSRVRPYWPALVWAGSLLLIIVQSWWAMFDLRDHESWTFLSFTLILLHPTFLYLMSVLALPGDDAEVIDLKANYYAQAPWFFGSAVVVILLSLLRSVVLDGAFEFTLDQLMQLIFLAVSVGGIFVRREAYHRVVAPLAAAGFLLYVGLLFFQLR